MMKMFGHPWRPSSEAATDKIRLVDKDTDGTTSIVDDDIDDDYDDTEEMGVKKTDNKCFECEKCQRHKLVHDVDPRNRAVYATSADPIEICVVDEEMEIRKKKKPLKKRVRKRVWRVMRSSWKYLRRGMSAYSPALGSFFMWGVNFNQAVHVRATARTSHV